MRIGVTGAAGRVGRRLVIELASEGHDVVAIDRVAPVDPDNDRIRGVQADLTDAQRITEALSGVDTVVHLAAAMSWRDADNESLRSTNIDGTWHVLQAAVANRCRRIVFASSGEVYPESKAQFLPVDEHHPRQPTTFYGLTKLVGENMTQFVARRHGLETVVVRLPHTQEATELLDPASAFSGPRFFLHRRIEQQRSFGNDDAVKALEAHSRNGLTLLLARGEDGTPFRMPIGDSRDVAHGLALAATCERAAGETFGIGPDDATAMDDLIPHMAEITGLPYADVRLPGAAVNYHTSNARAREVLGFEPQWPVSVMVTDAARWWRSQQADTPTSAPTRRS